MIFCPMSIRSQDSIMVKPRADKQSVVVSPSFFFGTDRGAIVFADDFGHCTDVQQLSSSIDSMMFYEEKSRLIIITRSLLLTQYQVTDDGRVSRVMQVKLSVSGDTVEKGIKYVVWAGPGLIAAATEEKIVRLLDIAADESYNISLNTALGDHISRSDRVSCVAFSPVDRYLGVGTAMGLIAIWKFTGFIRDVSSTRTMVAPTTTSDWQVKNSYFILSGPQLKLNVIQLIFKCALSSPVVQLSWFGGRGVLAASTEDGAVILNESVMHATMCGDLFVMQTSSSEIAVLTASSSSPNILNSGFSHFRIKINV